MRIGSTQQQAAEKLALYEVKYLPRSPAHRACNVEMYSLSARMPYHQQLNSLVTAGFGPRSASSAIWIGLFRLLQSLLLPSPLGQPPPAC
jgi:hypothetical protein